MSINYEIYYVDGATKFTGTGPRLNITLVEEGGEYVGEHTDANGVSHRILEIHAVHLGGDVTNFEIVGAHPTGGTASVDSVDLTLRRPSSRS